MLVLKYLENFCWNFVISGCMEVGVHSIFLNNEEVYSTFTNSNLFRMWCDNQEKRTCVLEIYLL